MAYQPSNLGYIGIGSQGTAKTTAVTPDIYVQYTSDNIAPEFDEVLLREGGDGQYDVTQVKTQHRERVEFSMYARPKIAGEVYAALLGTDVPSHLTTSPFTHTITPKTWAVTTQVQPWLTVTKMLVGTTNSRIHRIKGVKLNDVTIEGQAGQPVTMSVSGTGITGGLITTKTTPAYENVNPFSFYHGTFLVNTPTTTNFDIKSFSVKLSAVNDEAIQTTELTRRDIINHRFTGEVTLGLNYVDYVMWAKSNYGAGTTPTESYSDGSVNITLKTGAGTTLRSCALVIPKVRLKAVSIPLNPNPETIEQPLAGIAMKMATTALVTVTAKNMIATTMPL